METVLLHGALGSGAQMAGLAAAVGGEVRHPDLDGHGSREAGPYRLDAFVGTALQGQGPVSLVGYSLGGYVALAAALARPDQVRRVVTIATKLVWSPQLAAREARRLDADHLAERNPSFVDRLQAQHPGPGARSVLDGTAGFLLSLGTAPRLPLAQLRCPALVVVGADDALVGEEDLRAAQELPDVRLEVLPAAPHQLEQMPMEVLGPLVRDFLA